MPVDVREFLVDNLLRIKSGEGSPKVLIGGINLGRFPNFHTIPMLDMGASLVTLTPEEQIHTGRIDLLYCAQHENLASVLHRLPSSWRPDFFLDLQVEHGHWLPIGLGEVPFPTVVTVNHAHLGQVLWHMQGMFDCVIAPSPMMAHMGDHWLPWGGSWGTMDLRIRAADAAYKGEEKTVTVCAPIGLSGVGEESSRHAVLREMQRIKEERPDWTVEVGGARLEKAEYFNLLGRSKVVVNVGTWGSPVGYRPLETIAQEAILVHVEETAYGSTATIGEVFRPGWYVGSTPEGLERAIEEALSRTERAAEIKAEVEAEYSYKAQFGRIFEIAKKTHPKARMSLREWSRRAYAIGHLTGYDGEASGHAWSLREKDLCPSPGFREGMNLWQPRDPETKYRWQTDLARGEDPKEVYKRYAGTET